MIISINDLAISKSIEKSVYNYIVPVQAEQIQKDTGISGVNDSLSKLKTTINDITKFIVAFGLITSVLLLIIHFVRLGMIPARPFHRRKVIDDIAIVFICITAMGALGLIAEIIISVYENGLSSMF